MYLSLLDVSKICQKKVSLRINTLYFSNRLHKTLQDNLGPKYKITANFIIGFIISQSYAFWFGGTGIKSAIFPGQIRLFFG